jgi:hypothetical protein
MQNWSNPPEIRSPPEIFDFQICQNFPNLAEKTAIWYRCKRRRTDDERKREIKMDELTKRNLTKLDITLTTKLSKQKKTTKNTYLFDKKKV